MGDRRPGLQPRHHHRGQQLTGLERVHVWASGELGERDLPGPASAAARLEGGVHREQEGGRIGVRVGKTEVAPDRAHRPHAQVADPALHRRQRRPLASHGGVALDRTVGLRGPYPQVAVSPLDPAQLIDCLQVDHVRLVGKAELEQQEELGPAHVGHRVSAVAFEQIGCLLQRLRPVTLEWRQQRQAATVSRLSDSTCRVASAPAPTSTSTPRSSNPRPSADTAT